MRGVTSTKCKLMRQRVRIYFILLLMMSIKSGSSPPRDKNNLELGYLAMQ